MRTPRKFPSTLLVLFAAANGAALSAEEPAVPVLLPREILLHSFEARQPVIVQMRQGEQWLGEFQGEFDLASTDENVARVSAGTVIATGDGEATITARGEGWEASSRVRVEGFGEPFVWNFRNHVQSVFSKAGCNGGACHGARAGKNGFRLSLFAYDAAADYDSLVRQSRGRRVTPSDPGRSLVLTKPTGLLPHKGGLRLETGSREYRVLAEWIAAGSPPPEANDPRLARLEVLPEHSRQTVPAEQQILVRAYFDNGRVEDVTRWARYHSTNETAAVVDEAGNVRLVGAGEASIVVWYLNHTELARITAPFQGASAEQVEAALAAEQPRNFIDEEINRQLAELNLPPSPPASDSAFLRRAFLDTLGVLPTAEEAIRFLEDPAPEKRERLVDELLARPEFIDYWTYRWSDLLLVNRDVLGSKPAVDAYSKWIREQVAADTPWDVQARTLITARGSTHENGAGNFFLLHEHPTDVAETLCMTYMGLSINCAKCHNHPLEKWTNDQYYALANLFSRVRATDIGGDKNRTIFTVDEGDLANLLTGEVLPPQPLDGEPLALEAAGDRREHFARWLTSPENPYFTRAVVNRVWANYFGVGMVEPVDDLRLTNPAANEPLMEASCRFLVEHKYRLKPLMRAILTSAAYQRSSEPVAGNEADRRHFSRYYPRRLSAEVLLDVLSQVSGSPTEFKDYPAGTRALQLPDVSAESYFLKSFGRPERVITCDCERSDEPSMTQVLHLVNGDTLGAKLSAEKNRLTELMAAGASEEQVIEELYLAALSRKPSEAERTRLLGVLKESLGPDPREAARRQAFEDLYWSVLSSKAFLLNQ